MGLAVVIARGCTVGVLRSGVMAGSLARWVFFARCVAGAWPGLRLGLHRIGAARP